MKELPKDLIRKNRLFEAIQEMSALPLSTKIRKSLSVMESRLNAVNEKIRIGVLSEEKANLELNQIRNSLLEICEDIDRVEKTAADTWRPKLWQAGVGMGLMVLLIVLFAMRSGDEITCEDPKIAVLVADFQNMAQDAEVDAFSNSLMVRMDRLLENDLYDVTPVGKQSRKKRKYHEFIRQEYFASGCDTSGLFVNGFLSVDEKIFNVYMTIANLKMQVPEFSEENSIDLDNPDGLDFSILEDSKFLADFIHGIIMSYEGKTYEALEQFLKLETGENNDILAKDKNFRANLAHFKGNCYAMRGDEKRANAQYQIVEKNGNPELKKAARNNRQKATVINQKMKADPELQSKLASNMKEHSKFELELERFLNKFGNGVVNIIKNL